MLGFLNRKSKKIESLKLVFGVPLDPNTQEIPPVVLQCTEWLAINGSKNVAQAISTEGVFRLSANRQSLEEIAAKFDRGESVNFDQPIVVSTNPRVTVNADAHVVAGLLKKWVRELPEPLCTTEMYDMWMAAVSIKDKPTRLVQVKKILGFVPDHCRTLIKFLAKFLGDFAAHSDVTKMTIENLSICFAPNLLRAPDTIGLLDQIEESPMANLLMSMFIEHFNVLFEDAPIPSTFSSSPSTVPTESSSTAQGAASEGNNPSHPSNAAPPPVVAHKPVKPKKAQSAQVKMGSKRAEANALRNAPDAGHPPNQESSSIPPPTSSTPPLPSSTQDVSPRTSFSAPSSSAFSPTNPFAPPNLPPKPAGNTSLRKSGVKVSLSNNTPSSALSTEEHIEALQQDLASPRPTSAPPLSPSGSSSDLRTYCVATSPPPVPLKPKLSTSMNAGPITSVPYQVPPQTGSLPLSPRDDLVLNGVKSDQTIIKPSSSSSSNGSPPTPGKKPPIRPAGPAPNFALKQSQQ